MALSKFAHWCVAQDLCADDFTVGIKSVRVVVPGPQALTAVEHDRLIRQVVKGNNVRDIAVIVTLAHTGLRVAELCVLSRRDVMLSERKGELIVRAGKGEKNRCVPLTRDVRVARNKCHFPDSFSDGHGWGTCATFFMLLFALVPAFLMPRSERHPPDFGGTLALNYAMTFGRSDESTAARFPFLLKGENH